MESSPTGLTTRLAIDAFDPATNDRNREQISPVLSQTGETVAGAKVTDIFPNIGKAKHMSATRMEAWKMAVARASAYIQSNALFQIQLFGFYISAVVIGSGIGAGLDLEKGNGLFMFGIVIPALSLAVLIVSSYYFNRSTTQHVFIRLFGLDFDDNAEYKSADDLWQKFGNKKQSSIGLMTKIKYMTSHDYAGPYCVFFIIYSLTAIGSLFYYFKQNWSLLEILGLIVAPFIAFMLVAQITDRAWRVIEYEKKVREMKEGR